VLALPLSGYALLALLILAPLIRVSRVHGAVLAGRALLHLSLAVVAIVMLGIFGGVLLRLTGFNPSWAYELARWVWILAGWPILAWTAWQVQRTNAGLRTPSASEWIAALCLSAMALGVGLLVIAVLRADLWTRTGRWLVDDYSTWLQTDDCLAEHRLEYLTLKPDKYDFNRAPGQLAHRTLVGRGRQVNRSVHVNALRSYHRKVREGVVPEPETFMGALCTTCPDVTAELEEWVKDERLPEETRRLAEAARSRILNPDPSPSQSHDDRRLRYPGQP
jgi:hypothetical protein